MHLRELNKNLQQKILDIFQKLNLYDFDYRIFFQINVYLYIYIYDIKPFF